MKKSIAYFLILGLLSSSCMQKKNEVKAGEINKEIRDSASYSRHNDKVSTGLGKFFEEAGYDGSIIIYDLKKDKHIYYNPNRCNQRFSPASTFKIFNTLVGLETGAVGGPGHVFYWDGKKREIKAWNKNQTLSEAYKNSTVWYYQKLANRVGLSKMSEYLNEMKYGNMKIDKISEFWLNGALKISQEEQVDFLQKVYNEEPPFSKESYKILKDIMIEEENGKYVLRSKTGLSVVDGSGWYVGWVEKNGSPYFFATNIKSGGIMDSKFMKARIEITHNILKELGIIS